MKGLATALFVFAALASPAGAAVCSEPNSIIKITTGKVGPREYVNFYFKRPSNSPSHIIAVTGPDFVQDPGGNTVHVPGNRWTQVRFTGVNWTCTIKHVFNLPQPILKSIKSTGQFEGVVTYVIGRQNGHFLTAIDQNISGNRRRIRLKYGP